MESCYGGMSTRLKQRAVTEFLSAENVMPAEIHRRLQAVYGENTVNRTTVNRWAIKFHECEPGRANIVDQPRSGRPVSVTDDKHQKQVDELIKHDCHITQKQIAGKLRMSKERVGYITGLLGYTKVCCRWVPRMLMPMGAYSMQTDRQTKRQTRQSQQSLFAMSQMQLKHIKFMKEAMIIRPRV